MKLERLLNAARERLGELPSGALEAELLLAHALDAPRSFLYAHPESDLPDGRVARFEQLLSRRLTGEPIAYLTGRRAFWTLDLEVTPDVLIPRHETELLVECALAVIPPEMETRVADIGTGSGAIALALARERPEATVHASDISPAALDLARRNARHHGLENVDFRLGSWCKPLDGLYSVIVSNPPYVDRDDPYLSAGDCRFEPRLALTPGPDGLAAIRALCVQVPGRLEVGGWLMLEHGHQQGPQVRQLLHRSGFAEIETHRDLASHERVTSGRWSA
ncbi:MAG: peptide chain release factor N(5)-glutamine methyltransferase [Xanthomonadales bacterium]|nr:peptide chain release factor N(5)-glutamine methyltransferase [Xanthomonadales bacterium]